MTDPNWRCPACDGLLPLSEQYMHEAWHAEQERDRYRAAWQSARRRAARIAEDEQQEIQDMATDLYRAEDRLAFVREMCDLADREGQQVTTEQVRAWTNYTGCGGAIVLPETDEHPAGVAIPVADEELAEADRYADMVNAPLRPETIAAIAERIKAGDLPVRKVKPREQP